AAKSMFRFGATRLGTAWGVLVDPVDGGFYVSETGRSRISHFTADGTWDYAFGAPPNPKKIEILHRPLFMAFAPGHSLVVADWDDTNHADRIVMYSLDRTPVRATTLTDVTSLFR